MTLTKKRQRQINANRKKWIEALRSNRYAQCTGVLHKFGTEDKMRHCCLGVAELVLCPERVGPDGRTLQNGDDGSYDAIAYALGVTPKHLINSGYHALRNFIRLNDGERLPFAAIADFAEQFFSGADIAEPPCAFAERWRKEHPR